jgi:hypothetical protein
MHDFVGRIKIFRTVCASKSGIRTVLENAFIAIEFIWIKMSEDRSYLELESMFGFSG